MENVIFKGRFTADTSTEFVIFLIGMRINRWYLFHKWLPVFLAMPRMLLRLKSKRNLGMLHCEQFFRFFPFATIMVTYWTDFDSLESFAKSSNEPHRSVWTRFMQKVGNRGAVGIWHETYKIKRGQMECIYNNMPKFGLAAAFDHIPINSKSQSARQRIEQ